MKQCPMFSIIIPAYNIADYIHIALNSVMLQTFVGWECICVDDGSTDKTGDVIDIYVARDKRFSVIHKMNEGVSAARNAAIDVAKGDYIIFLDGDDAYVPNALEYLADVIVQKGWPNILAYRSTSLSSHCIYSVIDTSTASADLYDLDNTHDLNIVLCRRLGNLIAWNACWKRDVVNKVRFEIMPNGEDVLWGMHCMMIARTMVISSANIYRHLDRQGSALQTISPAHAKSAIQCVWRMVESAASWDRRDEVSDVLFKRILCQALGYVRGVLSRLPFSARLKLRGEFLNALNFLCRKSGLLHGCKRLYFGIAMSNLLTRLLMLYMPFDLYAWRHRGRK